MVLYIYILTPCASEFLQTRQIDSTTETCLCVNFVMLPLCAFSHPTHLYSVTLLHTCISTDTPDIRRFSDLLICTFSDPTSMYIRTSYTPVFSLPTHLCLCRHARQTASLGLSNVYILTLYAHIYSHTLTSVSLQTRQTDGSTRTFSYAYSHFLYTYTFSHPTHLCLYRHA